MAGEVCSHVYKKNPSQCFPEKKKKKKKKKKTLQWIGKKTFSGLATKKPWIGHTKCFSGLAKNEKNASGHWPKEMHWPNKTLQRIGPKRKTHFSGLAKKTLLWVGPKHASVDWPKKKKTKHFSGLAKKTMDWPNKTLQWIRRKGKHHFNGFVGKKTLQWICQKNTSVHCLDKNGLAKKNTSVDWPKKKRTKTLQWIGREKETLQRVGRLNKSGFAERKSTKKLLQWIGRKKKHFNALAEKTEKKKAVDWPKKTSKPFSALVKKNTSVDWPKNHFSGLAEKAKETLQWIGHKKPVDWQKKTFSGLAEKEKLFSGLAEKKSGLAKKTLQ